MGRTHFCVSKAPLFQPGQHFNKHVWITSCVPSTLPEVSESSENETESLPSGRRHGDVRGQRIPETRTPHRREADCVFVGGKHTWGEKEATQSPGHQLCRTGAGEGSTEASQGVTQADGGDTEWRSRSGHILRGGPAVDEAHTGHRESKATAGFLLQKYKGSAAIK